MRICALLAFLGALMSVMFIKNEVVNENDKGVMPSTTDT
jgi:hypothetical protein